MSFEKNFSMFLKKLTLAFSVVIEVGKIIFCVGAK